MTELEQLRKNVYDARKAYSDFINKNTVPSNEPKVPEQFSVFGSDQSLGVFNLTVDLLKPFKELNENIKKAENDLKEYVQNNPSYNILTQ